MPGAEMSMFRPTLDECKRAGMHSETWHPWWLRLFRRPPICRCGHREERHDEIVREDGLSADEGYVKDALSDAARGFARLAVQHPAEGREFTDGIHRCQSILAIRACRRAFPAGWPDKGSGS